MTYIKRDLEDKILSLSKEYSCILIMGPRQVGKTTVLRQLMDNNREYVTLDDLEERALAKRDPAMFLTMHSTPIMIDDLLGTFCYIGLLSRLTETPAPPIEFDENLWHAVVDKVTVYNDDRLVYSLKDGTEITVEL